MTLATGSWYTLHAPIALAKLGASSIHDFGTLGIADGISDAADPRYDNERLRKNDERT